jgi:hypothetical protein
MDFFEILDLSTPKIRQKYLLKTKYLKKCSLQATAVNGCAYFVEPENWHGNSKFIIFVRSCALKLQVTKKSFEACNYTKSYLRSLALKFYVKINRFKPREC